MIRTAPLLRFLPPLAGALLAVLALAPAAHAASTCDLGDLNGTYSFVAFGENSLGQTVAIVGTFDADGAGLLDGDAVTVENGLLDSNGFTCAVLMEADCSFSGQCIGDGEGSPDVQIDGAMADNNRLILLMLSEYPHFAGGATASGTAHQQ